MINNGSLVGENPYFYYLDRITSWDIDSIDEIPYWFDSSTNKIKKIIKSGKIIN